MRRNPAVGPYMGRSGWCNLGFDRMTANLEETMKTILSVLGLGFALAAPALAADKPEIKGYTRTGETTNCLMVNQIRESRILSKTQILFEMSGGTRYVSEPENCRLNKRYALKYDATINQLCTTTIVTLLDTSTGGPMTVGSCGLAPFEKLAKNPAS